MFIWNSHWVKCHFCLICVRCRVSVIIKPLSLVTQMPEEQAFSVLVKIMFDYGLRDLFKQNFEDLHCKFFQLERLMQVCLKWFACVPSIVSSPGLSGHCHLLLCVSATGIHTRSVHPFPQRGSGGSHVRLSVVPHALHSQVPSLHGLPYHRPATVRGRWWKTTAELIWSPSNSIHLFSVLTGVFLGT